MWQLCIVITSILFVVVWIFVIKHSIKDTFVANRPYVSDIATGANHTVFLSNEGIVFSCGLNNNGRLGIGNLLTTIIPTEVESLTNRNIVNVFAGNTNSFFSSEYGTYAVGDNKYSQLGIDSETEYIHTPTLMSRRDIIYLASGWDHTLVIDSNNNGHAVGYNGTGQLGFGSTNNITSIDRISTRLKIRQVATGWAHSLFLVEGTNDVYSCGWNSYGQLGTGDTNDRYTLTKVMLPESVKIVKIAAGMSHSIFVSNTGDVYVCGNNTHGQLGLELVNYPIPTIVKNIPVGVIDVSCNYEHTMFITIGGEVYGCGKNTYGQLGIGDKGTYTVPTKVKSLTEPIKKVCTGAGHTIFLTKSGIAYGCGKNTYGALGTGDLVEHYIPVRCNIDLGINRQPADFTSIYRPDSDTPSNPIQTANAIPTLLL